MGILSKKIWRYIVRNLGQFIAAAAVVMGGIMVYVSMSSAYYNLGQARDNFYRENRFADYYFHLVKAPEGVIKQITMLDGVKSATGRIQRDLSVIKENDERATARVVSYDLPMEEGLNQLSIVEGRSFEEENGSESAEVVLDPKYFKANRLGWGDEITAIVEGKEIFFTVVGSAISPEFIYAMKDNADILPDPLKFGIFMVENRQAQQILNMPGQINQVLVEFEPEADQGVLTVAIKDILKPYGLLASYPRSDQLSDAMLQAELDQLRGVTTVLPAIFLAIAAAIQFVILRRMIKTQRAQIGLMKGIGYHNLQIMLHYALYALAVSMAGAVAGILLGVRFSFYFTDLYATYFNLPVYFKGYNPQAIVTGIILCLAIGFVSGLTASRGVVKIQPAESMRPEPPAIGGKTLLEYWPWLWRRLSAGWKMTMRNINRNRGRFAVTLMGVIFSVALLVISFFVYDAVDYMMQKFFYQGQTYDLSIRFDSLMAEREMLNISHIDGVQKVEPFLELPVRIHGGDSSEDEVLLAYGPDLTMKELEDDDGRPILIPGDGILLNQRTARKLNIRQGDEVEVETLLPTGPVHREKVYIVGLVRQMVGSGSYIDLQQANRLLQERNLVSGAMLKVEPGKASQVEAEINTMPGVASVLSHEKEIANFENYLDTMDISIAIMVLFAAILGFAIVYNASVMNLAERNREIGCIRVIGFSVKEVSGLLFKENVVHTVLGVILGLPFGRWVASAYIDSITTDLYTLPVIIYPRTYLLAAVGTMTFIFLAHKFSVRGIKRLDLAEVLKSPE
ncbi:MAG: FtsX-like permease family protein [Syntrophomonadaceae bacterium]